MVIGSEMVVWPNLGQWESALGTFVGTTKKWALFFFFLISWVSKPGRYTFMAAGSHLCHCTGRACLRAESGTSKQASEANIWRQRQGFLFWASSIQMLLASELLSYANMFYFLLESAWSGFLWLSPSGPVEPNKYMLGFSWDDRKAGDISKLPLAWPFLGAILAKGRVRP